MTDRTAAISERGSRCSLRSDVRTRAAARKARKALERDLAAFTSPDDRSELQAMLTRYDDSDTAAVRRSLDRVLAS